MRNAVVRATGVIAVLVAGMVIGRSVLAENGSIAALTVRTSGAQEYVKVVAQNSSDSAITSTTWVTLTSASITVPAGHTDLVMADFFGESTCYLIGGSAGSTCQVRIRVGSTEMTPQVGTDESFDHTS